VAQAQERQWLQWRVAVAGCGGGLGWRVAVVGCGGGCGGGRAVAGCGGQARWAQGWAVAVGVVVTGGEEAWCASMALCVRVWPGGLSYVGKAPYL
jgi:hypothetical protein